MRQDGTIIDVDALLNKAAAAAAAATAAAAAADLFIDFIQGIKIQKSSSMKGLSKKLNYCQSCIFS